MGWWIDCQGHLNEDPNRDEVRECKKCKCLFECGPDQPEHHCWSCRKELNLDKLYEIAKL